VQNCIRDICQSASQKVKFTVCVHEQAVLLSSSFWVKGRTLAAALIDGSPEESVIPFPFVPKSPK
jgi:hypothetical protein